VAGYRCGPKDGLFASFCPATTSCLRSVCIPNFSIFSWFWSTEMDHALLRGFLERLFYLRLLFSSCLIAPPSLWSFSRISLFRFTNLPRLQGGIFITTFPSSPSSWARWFRRGLCLPLLERPFSLGFVSSSWDPFCREFYSFIPILARFSFGKCPVVRRLFVF